jgi:uncharacterized RDD family membrane protein YckC
VQPVLCLYAPVFRRLFAWCVDCAVVIAVLSLPVFDGLHVFAVISLQCAALTAYFALFCYFGSGATPGQRFLDIAVRPVVGSRIPPGRALIRGAVKAVLPFLAVIAAVRRDRRGVHDLLGGTIVLVTREPRPSAASPRA